MAQTQRSRKGVLTGKMQSQVRKDMKEHTSCKEVRGFQCKGKQLNEAKVMKPNGRSTYEAGHGSS